LRGSGAARLALLVLIVTALRAFAAVRFPMVSSEAYYHLWARHPDLGYFDHPPMVAWFGALFFGPVDASPLAARSGPILLGALGIVLVHRLARDLWPGGSTAWRAAVLFALAPIFFAGGVVLLPDTGLLLFCLSTWILFLRAVRRGPALLPWILAGLAAGGALLSKFHAYALLPPLYGYLLLVPGHRRLLATRGPWVALGTALACLAPNLLWNADHGFVTYVFQSERSGLGAPGFAAKNPVGYIAGPLVSLSPLLYAAVLAALVRGLRARREPETLYLLLAGAPILVLFALLCPFTSIGLHWPAVGFVPLVILAARGMELGCWPRLARWSAPVAGLFLVLLLAAPDLARRLPDRARLPLLGDRATAGRLKEALVDWAALGREVREVVEQAGPERFPMTMTDDFHLAALLAFHAAAPDRTFVFRARKAHQFGLWLTERPDLRGRDAIVVLKVRERDGFRLDEDDERRLAEVFASVTPGPLLPALPPGGGRVSWALRVLFARDFRGLGT
jgi:4-amino-4-deoxy-L-arabinose transferase-like glycosyltransferase